MILGLEIVLLVFGIVVLVKGRFSISKNKEVVGAPARVLGVLASLRLPLAFAIGFAYGFSMAQQGREVDMATAVMIDAGIAGGMLIVLLVAGLALAKPKQAVPPPVPVYPVNGPPQFPGQPQG